MNFQFFGSRLTTARTTSVDQFLTPEQKFSEAAILDILPSQDWVNLGEGQLNLVFEPLKPMFLLLRFQFTTPSANTNNNTSLKSKPDFTLSFVPKLEVKNERAYILKGKNTQTKEQNTISVGFKTIAIAKEFADVISWANAQRPIVQKRLSCADYSYKYLEEHYSTTPWQCYNCMFNNDGKCMSCKTCNAPRQLCFIDDEQMIDDESAVNSNTNLESQDSFRSSPLLSAVTITNSEHSENDSLFLDMGMHSVQKFMPSAFLSMHSSTSRIDIMSDNDERFFIVDVDFTDENECSRLMNNIHVSMDEFTVEEVVFGNLSELASNLRRTSDIKYRTLALDDPFVKEKYLNIVGVEEYLKYLGFKEDESGKFLICRKGEPSSDRISIAVRLCGKMQQQFVVKERTIDLIKKASLSKSVFSKFSCTNTITQTYPPLSSNYEISCVTTNMSTVLPEAIFEDTEDQKNNQISHSAYNDEEQKRAVRDIVWGITDATNDNRLERVLFLCYPYFTCAADIMDCIEERYTFATENGLEKVQFKTVNLLVHWMKDYFLDFEREILLLDRIQRFREILLESKNNKLSKKLGNMIDKQSSVYNKKRKSTTITFRRAKTLGLLDTIPKNYNIESQSSPKIAQQMSLMLFDVFKDIEPREFIGQVWTKKNRKKLAPNLILMIEEINNLTKWVQMTILNARGRRWKIMKKIINMAWYLKNMRNYSSSCAIHTALQSTPIFRLKNVWKHIPKKNMQRLAEVKELFCMSDHYMKLRKLHRQAQSPAILHIAVFLKDLILIEESCLDPKNGAVNFRKLQKVYQKIDTLCMYQHLDFRFATNTNIQAVLSRDYMKNKSHSMEYMYHRSHEIYATAKK